MFFNEHGDRRYMCFIFIPIYSASIKKISKFIEFCKIAAAQRHSRRLHKEKKLPRPSDIHPMDTGEFCSTYYLLS